MSGKHRYTFTATVGGILLALAFGAAGQQASTVPVVGVLALGIEARFALLRDGLRNLGYEDGRNIRLEERVVDDQYSQASGVVQEFVRQKVNVIVSFGNTSTLSASKGTRTIPIVMVAAVDPVKEKLAATLSRPGGNVTGLTTIGQEIVPKRLQLAKDAMPGLMRLGVLWDPQSRGSANSFAQAKAVAQSLKLELHAVEARSAADFDPALATLAKAGVRIFVLMAAGMFEVNRPQLLEAAARYRLVGVYSSRRWTEGGGPLAYGSLPGEAEGRASLYVDKILKGAKPGDLPIEQPTTLELAVNMKAARALGLAIPQSILLRADRVIE